MKELQTILHEAARLKEQNARAVLATVVDVQGSGYRLPGARMLISETGETFGTVSGGCLETDVLEHARRVLQTGEPIVLAYDTRDKADSVFSLNMGCNGVVRILLEAIENNDFFNYAENCIRNRASLVVASLIASSNETKFKTGLRFLFNGVSTASEKDLTKIEQKLFDDASEILVTGVSTCKTYEIENETVEFFLEIIKPPVNLIIFGAGYDAVPVGKFAKDLGWRVCIVDHRSAFATKERFPSADEILVSRPENLNANFIRDENAVAVVMTHNYLLDREIIKFLLARPLLYIGALGPKKRTENLLQELADQNVKFELAQLNKLYAPIGMDIGAASPETIALSILAEIQCVLSNREGGFLRDRKGSIYNRKKDNRLE